MLQEFSFLKLQDSLGLWLRKDFEVLSISIGRTEIKAVVYIKEQEEGIDFSCCYDLGEEARDYSWLGNSQILLKMLEPLAKDLVKAGYVDDKVKVIVTLEDYAFTERLDLPELERKDLEEALNWEVPEHVPWDKGSYTFQYLIKKSEEVTEGQINDNALAKLQQVYIYAVENMCVEALVEAIKSIGWELVGITVAEALTFEEFIEQVKLIDFYEAHYTEEQLAGKQELYAIPIMAAMAYGTGRLHINFLPKEDRYRVKLTEYKVVFNSLSCVCLGVSLLMSTLAYGYHYKEDSELEERKMQESNMAIWKERIQETKKLQVKEQRLSQQIKQIEAKKILWSGIMKDLGRLVPQGVWLTKVNQQAEVDAANNKRVRIMLQGQAQSVALVSQLMQNLEQSKNLHRFELVNSGTDAKDGKGLAEEQLTSFIIKAELNKTGSEADNGNLSEKISVKDKHKGAAKQFVKNNNEVKKEA